MPQQKQTHVVLLSKNQKNENDQLKQQSITVINFLEIIFFTHLSCCSQYHGIYCINVFRLLLIQIYNALGTVGLKHLIPEVSIAIELGLEFLQNYINSGINYSNEWVSLEKPFFSPKAVTLQKNNIYLSYSGEFPIWHQGIIQVSTGTLEIML